MISVSIFKNYWQFHEKICVSHKDLCIAISHKDLCITFLGYTEIIAILREVLYEIREVYNRSYFENFILIRKHFLLCILHVHRSFFRLLYSFDFEGDYTTISGHFEGIIH